jgi:transmembrane sensor
MSRVADEDGPAGPAEEAAEWCMRLADGDLVAEDWHTWKRWIAIPENRAAFEATARVWEGVGVAAGRPEVIHFRAQALVLMREAHNRRWTKRILRSWRRPMAVAASILVMVTASIFAFRAFPDVYATDIGERRVVNLGDGSRLTLDASSRIEVRLRGDRRDLRLTAGRARFDVAPDPLRPFSVAAGGKVVVAIGTSFSVEKLRNDLHVVLYKGRVDVLDDQRSIATQVGTQSQTSPITLTPGRQLIAHIEPRSAGSGTIVPIDTARSLSWESGQLNFVDEPLSSAVERINRYARTKLVISDPAIASYVINGVFAAGDTDAFVEAVATFLPVEVTRKSDEVVLRAGSGAE